MNAGIYGIILFKYKILIKTLIKLKLMKINIINVYIQMNIFMR